MMRGGNRNMRRMMDKMGLDMSELPNVQGLQHHHMTGTFQSLHWFVGSPVYRQSTEF